MSYKMPLIFILLVSSVLSFVVRASEPIGIILNDWSSQRVASHITANLLTNQGFSIRLIESNVELQWHKLKQKKAHVQMEVWQGTMAKEYQRMIEIGAILDAGTHEAKTREDWWYPAYLQADCPGLPDWRALNKCVALFETPSTSPKGQYLGGPWEKPEAVKIKALDLNYKLIRAEDGPELAAAISKAAAEQRAILVFNWSPSWVENKIPGFFIEFPAYDPACEIDPAWGINPTELWDCGNPAGAWLKKVVSADFDSQWPCAFQLIQNIIFSNRLLSEFSALVDIDALVPAEAATLWMQNNRSVWQAWMPKDCRP